MAKTTPANLGASKPSMQAVVQPVIPRLSGHGGPLVETNASPYNVQSQENTSDTAEQSTIILIDDAFKQHKRLPSPNNSSVDSLEINSLLSHPSTLGYFPSEPFHPERFPRGPLVSSSSLSVVSFVRSPPIFSSTLSLPLSPIYSPPPLVMPPNDTRKGIHSSSVFGRIRSASPPPTLSPVLNHETTSPVLPPATPTEVRRKPRSLKFFNRIKSAFTSRQPSLVPSNETTPSPPMVSSHVTPTSVVSRPSNSVMSLAPSRSPGLERGNLSDSSPPTHQRTEEATLM